MPYKNMVGPILRAWLDANGYYANDLARLSGVSRARIYQLLNSPELKRPPHDDTITRLAKVVGQEKALRDAAFPEENIVGNRLSVLIQQRMRRKGLTTRDVEEQSKARGTTVWHSTVARIVSGKQTTVSDDQLRVLATVLADHEIPKGRLYDALKEAADEITMQTKYQLPPRAADLDPENFKALLNHMDYLLGVQRRQSRGH